jgi:hypothetical protein
MFGTLKIPVLKISKKPLTFGHIPQSNAINMIAPIALITVQHFIGINLFAAL